MSSQGQLQYKQLRNSEEYLQVFSERFVNLVEKYCSTVEDSDEESAIRINLIGMNPYDYRKDDIYSIRRWAAANEFEIVCSIGETGTEEANEELEGICNVEEISHAGDADISLVISSCGIDAAKALEQKLGVPFVISVPYGTFGERVATAIRQIVYEEDELYCGNTNKSAKSKHINEKDLFEKMKSGQKILIIGEYVTSISLARKLELEKGVTTRVITPVKTDSEIVRPGDLQVEGFEGVAASVANEMKTGVQGIVADPLYQDAINRILLDEGIQEDLLKLYSLPHRALSGETYDEIKIGGLW